ncbi:hypothetical protein LEMLEM_LOCUS8685 [Lemmus lemmus]
MKHHDQRHVGRKALFILGIPITVHQHRKSGQELQQRTQELMRKPREKATC